ncbi:hypothetical protein BTR14_21815 [Rhizobium rhizosphaerae]|uniref:DUF559 domain-containing protein n=1 Tax=Xaviernesmea rhizosphaerae TaxID=1672749 RepID=A0ABX3P8L5_9HYPH|nr:DUF559 domain-containing protein [Xaviernesmea rhizosphaerae]OQP83705.1 hypothetical protein BTR14_21815 [Xaviernesmea rhizosphaerae]
MSNVKSPISKRRLGATATARKLRKRETDAEHLLWMHLRNRLLNGYKFSRQIPLGPYVVDFVCRDKRLIIELDGFQHADSKEDQGRTEWLNGEGYSVLRFWNHETTHHLPEVLATILAALEGQFAVTCETVRFYGRRQGMWRGQPADRG